jgi:hypothetical protein
MSKRIQWTDIPYDHPHGSHTPARPKRFIERKFSMGPIHVYLGVPNFYSPDKVVAPTKKLFAGRNNCSRQAI